MEPSTKRNRMNDYNPVEYKVNSNVRISSLDQPTMKLSGHKGSIYSLEFNSTGEALVSGGFDMMCLLWNTTGYCTNYNILVGHKNAILDLAWSSDSDYVVTASADKTLGWFHANTGIRVKRLQGHSAIVNAVDTAKTSISPIFVSGSDDKCAKLWDARMRRETGSLEHNFQVTSVAFFDESNTVFTGGIDNQIVAWDTRKLGKIYVMKGHTDTITSLSLHPQRTHILSNSMDGTIRSWDIRPFVTGKRYDKSFLGSTHNAEKGLLKCSWSADGKMVSGGSADRMVRVWDELTAEELYLLPGHTGCVNSVVFHPKENVIASGSSDKSIFVGELS
mmetsp:Transcript_35585/g.40530  ORF Transcript_35585/g.40530 Transcript_35585/m.40530 type:complete len:333 (+) Transcript_35585:64-1062(+)